MTPSAYRPYEPLRRPGGRPDFQPVYRVVIKGSQVHAWTELVDAVGVTSAQQCWDHLATDPGGRPPINSANPLKGKNFGPQEPFSRVIHYRAGGALRLDYRFANEYRTRPQGDAHKVTAILHVYRTTAGT